MKRTSPIEKQNNLNTKKILGYVFLVIFILLGLFISFSLSSDEDLAPEESEAGEAPTPKLIDFWEGRAEFTEEEKITSDGPYNSEHDFYYDIHDSGMSIIQDPSNPDLIYYFLEQHDGTFLRPHIYISDDGGIHFKDLGSIFNVSDTDCSEAADAKWLIDSKTYCIFQMREPDVYYKDGNYWLAYETAAKTTTGEEIIGPAIVKITQEQIDTKSFPLNVEHNINLRSTPIFTNYDGDIVKSGLQETSGSTPVWFKGTSDLHIFWAGVHPVNSTWERVDAYRGHFENNGDSCSDPMNCEFKFDESLITNPNLTKGSSGKWDDGSLGPQSIIKEGAYNYMFYGGASGVDCEQDYENRWGLSIARSSTVNNWEKLYKNNSEPAIIWAGLHNTLGRPSDGCSYYAKLTSISDEYYMYFYEKRAPLLNGETIARVYRRKLNWKPENKPTETATQSVTATSNDIRPSTMKTKPEDLDKNGSVGINDFRLFVTDYKTGNKRIDFNKNGIYKEDIGDFVVFADEYKKENIK